MNSPSPPHHPDEPLPPTRRAPRWLSPSILAGGLGLFEIIRAVLATTNNPNLIPSLILLGAVVVPAAFVAFISSLRLSYDVPAGTLIAVAFVGGVVGVVTAGLLEYQTLRHLGTLPLIGVAFAEEASKLIAPLGVLLVTPHRRRADGLLVGVACGAGFAAMETMGYAAVALLESHRNLGAVASLLLQRGFFSPATHMAWTGITAAALWYAAARRWQPAALAALAGVFMTAVALHTAWDATTSPPVYILLAAISLGLLAITTHRLETAEHATPPPKQPEYPNGPAPLVPQRRRPSTPAPTSAPPPYTGQTISRQAWRSGRPNRYRPTTLNT
jgi:protease PrsW